MQNKKFEEKYFSEYYKRNVGEFTKKDLEKSIRWFYGWLKFLDEYVDLKEGRGRRVLEIGCSIGGACSILADRGFEVFASDTSEYAIQRASKLAKGLGRKISFYKFDVQNKIPISGTFDIVYAFEVIEHLNNPFSAIKNMRSKLKADGVLICSTPNKDYDMSSDPTHINVKSGGEWKRIFKNAGFTNIKVTQVSFLPFFYKWNRYFHFVLPIAIRSKYINSPLFIIAKK